MTDSPKPAPETSRDIETLMIEHERLCMEELRAAFVAEDASRAIEPVTARILLSRAAISARFEALEQEKDASEEAIELAFAVLRLQRENAEARQILADGVDRDKDPKDTLRGLAAVAVNGIYWRDKENARLRELTLTAEEARLLLKGLDGQVVHVEPAYNPAVAKLRRIAGESTP